MDDNIVVLSAVPSVPPARHATSNASSLHHHTACAARSLRRLAPTAGHADLARSRVTVFWTIQKDAPPAKPAAATKPAAAAKAAPAAPVRGSSSCAHRSSLSPSAQTLDTSRGAATRVCAPAHLRDCACNDCVRARTQASRLPRRHRACPCAGGAEEPGRAILCAHAAAAPRVSIRPH